MPPHHVVLQITFMVILASEQDFTTSLRRALAEIHHRYEDLPGLVIAGSHTPSNVGEKLEAIRMARESRVPFLGICFGHQLAAIEYARNVLGIEDATSEEFGSGTYVVRKRMDGLNVGMGGDGESYWNNYEVDLPQWKKPKWFFTSQFHPEYESRKGKPHPLLVQFIQACKNAT